MQEVVFVGSAFVAKYPEGGGNFSVVLQYLLGLRAMGLRGIWVEVLPCTGADSSRLARIFHRRLKFFGLENDYHLLVCSKGLEGGPFTKIYGLSAKEFENLLAGPNTLLNLSYSLRSPFLERFERRILCSLDPTEICFWMQRMEMGQSFHHEFASIGLNISEEDSRVPASPVRWKKYFPLVDTALLLPAERPRVNCFTTVGQWYWDGSIEWDGKWRDFSKKAAFEPFLALPRQMPAGRWKLAMNLSEGDPEIERLKALGWHFVHPHQIARTPQRYYEFLKASTAEFTAVKLESFARSGWLSDRSAAYLALGRPVITESTGAEPYLPEQPGLFFVANLAEATEAARRVLLDWKVLSRNARECAMECFDAKKNLRYILGKQLDGLRIQPT